MRPEYIKTQCKHCGKKVRLYRRENGSYIAVRGRLGKAGIELAEHDCKQQKKSSAGTEG